MSPHSLVDLARRIKNGEPAPFRGVFTVDLMPTARLLMNDKGWSDTFAALHAPREVVETQELVLTRDVRIGYEAVFNSLRGRRGRVQNRASSSSDVLSSERQCPWCDQNGWHVNRPGLWEDDFGDVLTTDGRVCGRPNWARQAPVSGIVFGDELMHDPLGLSRQDFVALFEGAELYVAKARALYPDIPFFMIFMNGGSRSAASVGHAHLQVVGRPDRHFAYPESFIRRGGLGYWEAVRVVHEELGLAVSRESGTAWASLVPTKDREVTGISDTLRAGASLMHEMLARLIEHGTGSFSLAAIPAPWHVATSRRSEGVADLPPVLWKLVDRGDVEARHADIGCMELFGTSVVGTDPFMVAQWLRGNW